MAAVPPKPGNHGVFWKGAGLQVRASETQRVIATLSQNDVEIVKQRDEFSS
jgi:hypothetical protein